MNELQWADRVTKLLHERLTQKDVQLRALQGVGLPYAHEVLAYSVDGKSQPHMVKYETDILVAEYLSDDQWKPRVVIECKIDSVTTHDAITYSQKASTHKNVHPYLRYGILLGHRQHYPLPGRLFRHGAYFDFMQSWREFDPTHDETETLITVVFEEVQASRQLEEIIYNSRSANRARYTVLHRPLRLQ